MNNQLISELNQLLADMHIYYQNTRGFHWNIKGSNFFQLHAKFEELYTEALGNIDEIAERTLTIGGQPSHTLETYLEQSNIKSVKGESNDRVIIEAIVQNLKQLIAQENKVKEVASATGDSETEDMMIALVNSQEKTNWMFAAWLDN